MSIKIEHQLGQGPITRIEQHIVKRLAPFVPTSITPNAITIASSIAGILTGVCLVFTAKWSGMLFVASFCMFLHWLGDTLDGAVARFFKKSSKTGFYLDHMLDTITILAVFVGLYYSNFSETALPLIFGFIYLLLEVNILMQTIMFGTFKISLSGFGPGEANFLFIIANTLAFFFPRIFGFAFWDAASLAAIIFLLPAFFFTFLQTIKQARALDLKS